MLFQYGAFVGSSIVSLPLAFSLWILFVYSRMVQSRAPSCLGPQAAVVTVAFSETVSSPAFCSCSFSSNAVASATPWVLMANLVAHSAWIAQGDSEAEAIFREAYEAEAMPQSGSRKGSSGFWVEVFRRSSEISKLREVHRTSRLSRFHA